MAIQPQILIRDMPRSPALETYITKKINKLSQFCDDIMHCDVEVFQAQKHNHTGKLYQTRIAISVPNSEFAVNHHVDEDVYVSMRDSFKAARRQLQEYMEKRRGDVKTHRKPPEDLS
jgi:ribosomal subunit interface protein